MRRGDGPAGDGAGLGAGGLEPLWPQPLHFSRFRFVNSSWLRAGGMGPAPSVACVQGGPGLSSCRHPNPGFEDPCRHQGWPSLWPGQAGSGGPGSGQPQPVVTEVMQLGQNLMTWPHWAYL